MAKQLQIVEQFADVKKKRDPLVEELNKAGLPVKDEEPEDGEEKFDHDETPPEFRMPECHLLEKLLGRETDTMHEEQTDFFKKIKSLSNCAGKQKSIYKNQYDPRFALLEEILIESHPAMTEVIDFLCSELILSARQERPSPRPILMVGQPGIGKTHFARSIANVTGAPFINFSCATADAPWALTGSNSTWNKGKPSSFIFEIARTNAHAGVFFCDEANEGNQDNRHYPIEPVLLELLDLDQSSRFKDLYFEHEMDLSGWIKILACNSTAGIDSAILDRCEVIQVSRPTAEQQLKIIQMMAAKLPVAFEEKAMEALNVSTRSLRQINADLRRLAARALRNACEEVNLIDVKRLGLKSEFRS
ncbi:MULTISPECIES: AAA family ATPase [unclassified Limnobacter]|uniref:AAA family ATPase n=1 Tax=unclassified Limnobacter TaxID=2630203 RepID=UPI0014446BE1|nr:AAA family ATPase [Limnobacter sp. SAORIC-690]